MILAHFSEYNSGCTCIQTLHFSDVQFDLVDHHRNASSIPSIVAAVERIPQTIAHVARNFLSFFARKTWNWSAISVLNTSTFSFKRSSPPNFRVFLNWNENCNSNWRCSTTKKRQMMTSYFINNFFCHIKMHFFERTVCEIRKPRAR